MQIGTIGFDLAKNVFQVHGIDANEQVIIRKQLRRSQVMAFFEALAPCLWAWKPVPQRIIESKEMVGARGAREHPKSLIDLRIRERRKVALGRLEQGGHEGERLRRCRLGCRLLPVPFGLGDRMVEHQGHPLFEGLWQRHRIGPGRHRIWLTRPLARDNKRHQPACWGIAPATPNQSTHFAALHASEAGTEL